MIKQGDKVYNTDINVIGEVVYVDETTAAIVDSRGRVHECVPSDCEFVDNYRLRAAEMLKIPYHKVTVAQRQAAKRELWMEAYKR